MKKTLFLLTILFSVESFAQLTNENFISEINACLTTNPIDGLCESSIYGVMPDWDVSQVTDMSWAFDDQIEFNGDISAWDVSNVTNMSFMFTSNPYSGGTAFNQNIGEWNVSNVTNMEMMFGRSTAFNQNIGNWDVSNVIDMSYMFLGANSFNQDIGNWDVSNVTKMHSMFTSAVSFNQDIGEWNVSNVTNMISMFGNVNGPSPVPYAGAISFNQDIGDWDVSNVDVMINMFKGATAFDQNISAWDVSNVSNMSQMLNLSGLSIANYDALLMGWSTQDVQPNVPLGALGLKYCLGESARSNLINTHNWSVLNDSLDCPVANIFYPNELEISIYPNPTTKKVFIDWNDTPLHIALYDLLGNRVLHKNFTNSCDLSHLESGIYKAVISNGLKSTTMKIVKN
jgi:surface protein